MSDRFARARAGYDDEFKRRLVEAIFETIATESIIIEGETRVLALRTGETASALITALAAVLAMSPAAARSPTAIRHTVDELVKRLRRRIAAAERDPAVQEFLRRCFNGTGAAGRA